MQWKQTGVTISEIKNAAYQGRKPQGMTALQDELWLSLKGIYKSFGNGECSFEAAEKKAVEAILKYNREANPDVKMRCWYQDACGRRIV